MAMCMPWAVRVPRKDPRRPFNNFCPMAELEVVINWLNVEEMIQHATQSTSEKNRRLNGSRQLRRSVNNY